MTRLSTILTRARDAFLPRKHMILVFSSSDSIYQPPLTPPLFSICLSLRPSPGLPTGWVTASVQAEMFSPLVRAQITDDNVLVKTGQMWWCWKLSTLIMSRPVPCFIWDKHSMLCLLWLSWSNPRAVVDELSWVGDFFLILCTLKQTGTRVGTTFIIFYLVTSKTRLTNTRGFMEPTDRTLIYNLTWWHE